jgi:hypothetical protein
LSEFSFVVIAVVKIILPALSVLSVVKDRFAILTPETLNFPVVVAHAKVPTA